VKWTVQFEKEVVGVKWADLRILIPDSAPEFRPPMEDLLSQLGFSDSLIQPSRFKMIIIAIGQGYH